MDQYWGDVIQRIFLEVDKIHESHEKHFVTFELTVETGTLTIDLNEKKMKDLHEVFGPKIELKIQCTLHPDEKKMTQTVTISKIRPAPGRPK